MSEIITSTKNPIVRSVGALRSRKERKARGLILVEGPNLFEAAVAAGIRFDTILATQDDAETHLRAGRLGHRLILVSDRVLAAASETEHPRSPIAAAFTPQEGVPRAHNTVVLVDIADPGNAGTIIRTAAAFGWDVARTPNTVDIWSPKTLRSAAGAHFATHISPLRDVAEVTGTHTVVATVARDGHAKTIGTGPYALLVGNEAHGLDEELVDRADGVLSIPMAGEIDSLNAAVAAGIAMYILDSNDHP